MNFARRLAIGLAIFILPLAYFNCSGTFQPQGADDAHLQQNMSGGGGTDVGDPKATIAFAAFNWQPNSSERPVRDVRFCIRGIRMYYDSLSAPIHLEANMVHEPELKSIAYTINREVALDANGTMLTDAPVIPGNYRMIEIYARAGGYFDGYACSFQYSPMQVTNGYGTFMTDTIYLAMQFEISGPLDGSRGLRLPIQTLIEHLQPVKSSADLYDVFYNQDLYPWPQNSW